MQYIGSRLLPGLIQTASGLATIWAACGVRPADIWAEMERRDRMLGIAEKVPKPGKAGSRPNADVKPAAIKSEAAKVVPRRAVAAHRSERGHKRRFGGSRRD